MMKLLNKKQKNNGGFSLVELIVVIAIMVVLVAVLAPVFTKYIENSRRSTDVQNANAIAEAVLADVADNKKYDTPNTKVVANTPTAIKEEIKTKGDGVATGRNFIFTYNSGSNHCAVYIANAEGTAPVGGDLTDETNATNYKDAKEGEYGAATP